MQQVKFLANGIRKEAEIEFVFESVLEDVKKIGKCETEYFNVGEFSFISPDHMLITCQLKMNFNSKVFNILFHKQTYKIGTDKEIYTLEVTIKSDEVDGIYDYKVKIKDVLGVYYKEIFVLMDADNQLLCSQLYPEIHRVENRFREAINSYMVKKYGVDWFKQNIKDEFQNKSNQYAGWYNRKYIDFRDIQSEIFNLQTDDLIKMLEKSYVDQLNKSEVDSITTLKDKLNDKAALVFRDKYLDLQSIWDTDIKGILPDDFSKIWKEFTNMRNMIAHNKPICMMLKADIEKMIEELDKILDNFRSKIDIRLKSLEKQEAKWIEAEINDDFCCEEAGIDKLPNRDDVIEEVFEHEDIQALYSIVEDFISDYNSVVEELEGCIEELITNTFEDYNIEELSEISLDLYEMLNKLGVVQDQTKIEIIRRSLSEDIRELVTEDLVGLFSRIEFDTDNIVQSNSFNESIIVFGYTNIFSERVEVKTLGDIFPEKGASNTIFITLNHNGKDREQGIITKWYGDYEMNSEQEYAMPTIADDLEVDIEGVSNHLYNHFEDTLNKIKEINEYLSLLVY